MTNLLKISLNNNYSKYKPILDDIIKYTSIISITYLLSCLTNPYTYLFEPEFYQTLFYLVISIIIYWMVIKKLVN